MARALTGLEIIKFRERMIREGAPVRFLLNGCNFSIETGETMRKGANVIHQIVYWNFDRPTANEIAALTGTSPVFC